MGKKKKQKSSLGNAVINDRFGGRKAKGTGDSYLHTSELSDGFEWGRLNLQSITEQSNLDDFLATAELAGTEFTAEKLNFQFVDPYRDKEIPSQEEQLATTNAQDKYRYLLGIPRRPKWNETTTAEELDRKEKDSFLEWRRQLALLQEEEHVVLTPFEKNLDFWRQLWRVIERSDIVVQIVDGRNPLLFRCEDLEKYVKEVGENKVNVILVNKADLLTRKQRKYWAEYFTAVGLTVVFWSAMIENERHKESQEDESDSDDDNDDDDIEDMVEDKSSDGEYVDEEEMADKEEARDAELSERIAVSGDFKERIDDILTGEELLDVLRGLHNFERVTSDVLTIGMVGYPNVGKSSSINAILQSKKVPVSSTPGRTKHFQTLYVEEDLLLCDCPGLVMPTFVATKADMVTNGILPIDHMREYIPPIARVCQQIPKAVLEGFYGINLPVPKEGEDPCRPPTAYELSSTYACMRGFMTTKGVPDAPRAARLILKDFVNGKLLYCHCPPGVDPDDFQCSPPLSDNKAAVLHTRLEKIVKTRPTNTTFDEKFFKKTETGVRSKGVHGVTDFTRVNDCRTHHSLDSTANSPHSSTQSLTYKPWKKHGNRNKKEKLRRLHRDLDKHEIL